MSIVRVRSRGAIGASDRSVNSPVNNAFTMMSWPVALKADETKLVNVKVPGSAHTPAARKQLPAPTEVKAAPNGGSVGVLEMTSALATVKVRALARAPMTRRDIDIARSKILRG